MERQLATIRKVGKIVPIEGKDRIVLAHIDGWQVIVQKDEFKEGDLCIYCEIDSVLPKLPPFEFLEKRDYRIKTLRMGGVLSQGICFPLSVMDDLGIFSPGGVTGWYEGEDVTDLIGVTKWERPDAEPVLKDRVKKPKTLRQKIIEFFKFGPKQDTSFPSFVHKTDETRIQNAPQYLVYPTTWTLTEKVDGTSATFAIRKVKHLFKDKYEYYICSRNRRLPVDDGSVYWEIYKKYNIADALRALFEESTSGCEWLALQGEIVGPGIQGNKYKLKEHQLYLFNYITNYGRMNSLTGRWKVATHGLSWVPIVDNDVNLPDTMDEMVALAGGQSRLNPNTRREGLVCRSAFGMLSFKCVDPEFLLKNNE